MKQVENALKLRNLSKTRWVYRNESIEAVSNSFKAIRKALTEVTEKDNNETTNFRCPLQCLGFRTKGKKPVVRRRTRVLSQLPYSCRSNYRKYKIKSGQTYTPWINMCCVYEAQYRSAYVLYLCNVGF